ncbi:trimethylamine methyltransferase family protein [Candidatus Latescibacterota bacterium]
MRSFEISDETLALDLIDRLGPGGTFIAEEHTVRHFREEVWMPTVLDREYWANWENTGRKTADEKVKERLKSLLASYVPHPLDDDTEREMRTVVEKARAALG